MLTGIRLIALERERQTEKGWPPTRDGQYEYGELARAASGLAYGYYSRAEEAGWYISPASEYGGDRIRQLVVAGALIAAEIDRLQRLQARQADDSIAAVEGRGDVSETLNKTGDSLNNEPGFSGWVVVEVLGRKTYAGFASEREIAGRKFLQLEIPALSGNGGEGPVPAFTRYFGTGSVYAVEPVSESVARAVADNWRHFPLGYAPVWRPHEEVLPDDPFQHE